MPIIELIRKIKVSHPFPPSHANQYLIVDDKLRNEAMGDEGKIVRLREFGTELTNNTDACSDTNTDEKAPHAAVEESSIASNNIPHLSYKTHKMSDHFAGLSISNRINGQYKNERDLTSLKGDEFNQAIKEELKIRKKELNKDISFQDVINFRTPELVGEYVGQCMQWMKQQEEEFKLKTNYMDTPKVRRMSTKKKPATYQATREDRAHAIDLVMEIHRKYGLVTETLFVAVSTIDRYLATRKEPLKRQKDIEAIAISTLLIASKYEDIYPPALDEMIKMMAKPSNRREILEWEYRILRELTFQITVPTPFRFLERFASTSIVYANAQSLAQYIIELALYDYDILHNLMPSEIAAVAMFAAVNFDFDANRIADKQKWSSEISKEASIKKTKLIEYFNTYFVDLAYRAERDLKVNDIHIKYPQFQYVDDELIGLFDRIN